MPNEDLTVELLKKIQTLKYKYALIPLFLVVGSFFLSNKLPTEIVKISSVVGMILYLVILFKFRIGTIRIEIKPNEILSPISGTIKEISEEDSFTIIKISKGFFEACGIRFTFENDKWNENILINSETNISCKFSSDKILKNKTIAATQGSLAGFCLSKLESEIILPKNKTKINVKVGDRCSAGKTTLGFYNEN